jgi:RNA polymerase sigma-70 factor (ECF subfamily)
MAMTRPTSTASSDAPAGAVDFATVYQSYFHRVCCWLRAHKVPATDLDDAAQEVFLIVLRRLPDFAGGSLSGWLYAIVRRVAANQRRLSWIKHLFFRRRDLSPDELYSSSGSPAEALERKEAHLRAAAILERMSPKRSAVFYLFEVERYTCEEIAELEGIPVATVRTRLFHARKDFRALRERFERLEGEP